MTVYKLTKTAAKCDFDGCDEYVEVSVSDFGIGVEHLLEQGWWIKHRDKGWCLCPTHGRENYEAMWQKDRDHRNKAIKNAQEALKDIE